MELLWLQFTRVAWWVGNNRSVGRSVDQQPQQVQDPTPSIHPIKNPNAPPLRPALLFFHACRVGSSYSSGGRPTPAMGGN